ncbi:MAG: hypothetical protein Q7S63_01720 [bacterium]|nr:hypothetical protein [bacterium]
MPLSRKKAWVVTADMGYGHQRATWPLRNMALKNRVIVANAYPGMPSGDASLWKEVRMFYEAISRFTKFPVIGDLVFSLFDSFQRIEEFYPRAKSFAEPSFQLRQTYGLMKTHSWGKHLIGQLSKNPLPLITSFAPVALMAEYWKYPGPVFLIVTDSDISRSWAPLKATRTRILYCASTERSKERLQSYGVPKRNIKVTGFPLPEESLGKSMEKALSRRVSLLDPYKKYRGKYKAHISQYLKKAPSQNTKAVTVSFAIGGAGAQDDVAHAVMESLKPLLREGNVRLSIVLGTHGELRAKFPKTKGVTVEAFSTKETYFRSFPKIIEQTDILWTKPSELVFYAALGIPLLLAPPIGSQEVQNRKWVLDVGAGMDQMDPKLCHQWLPDLIANGRLAEAAMQGFVEMEKNGTSAIKKFVATHS